MKKWMLPLTTLTATAVLLGVTPTTATLADTPQEIKVLMNNKVIAFPDAKPFVDENDRTMVPVRFVAESMGATVDWMPNTQFVVIKLPGKDIRMRVGETKASVNGVSVMLDTKSVMTNDRTYVPLRFVSENLGADVKWDAPNNAVLITYKNPTNNGGGTIQQPQQDPAKTHITDLKLTDTDPWGRKIRTTNLPKNASDYPYILEDIQNEMYEQPYRLRGNKPAVVPIDTFKTTDQFTKENLDAWANKIRTHYNLILNVDYQRMPNDWVQQVGATYIENTWLGPVEKYADWVKSNEIKIEGSIEPEPSMVYYDPWVSGYHMRCIVKFRVDHYKEKRDIFLDDCSKDAQFEPNVWYWGYFDALYMGRNPSLFNWEVSPGGVSPSGSLFAFEHGPAYERLSQ